MHSAPFAVLPNSTSAKEFTSRATEMWEVHDDHGTIANSVFLNADAMYIATGSLRVEDNHHFDVAWDGVRHGPAKKIFPPTPAEGDLHPMNRDPNISPDIEQPGCWGNINKPLFRFKGPQTSAPGEEAQKSPEIALGGIEGEPEVSGSNNDQQYSNSGSNLPLLHGLSAPLIVYAIDAYDGENMDGIE